MFLAFLLEFVSSPVILLPMTLKFSFCSDHVADSGTGTQGSPGDWDEGCCTGPWQQGKLGEETQTGNSRSGEAGGGMFNATLMWNL